MARPQHRDETDDSEAISHGEDGDANVNARVLAEEQSGTNDVPHHQGPLIRLTDLLASPVDRMLGKPAKESVDDSETTRPAPASPMERRQLAALRRSGDLVDGARPAADSRRDAGGVMRSLLGSSFANTDATELAARPTDGLGPAI